MAKAREYVERLNQVVPVAEAYLVGSVARGDHNLHSDVDVVVISEPLPQHPLERAELLYRYVLPGVEPKGFTPAEWREMQRRKNPLALEVRRLGPRCRLFPPRKRRPSRRDAGRETR